MHLFLFAIAFQTVLGSGRSPHYSNIRSTSSATSDPVINLEIFRQCVNNKDIFNPTIIAKTANHFVPLQPPIFKQTVSDAMFREDLYKKRIEPMLSAAQVSQAHMPSANLCSYLFSRLPLVVLEVMKMGEAK
jgi:hypothetical protein